MKKINLKMKRKRKIEFKEVDGHKIKFIIIYLFDNQKDNPN